MTASGSVAGRVYHLGVPPPQPEALVRFAIRRSGVGRHPGHLVGVLVLAGCLGGRQPAPHLYSLEEVDTPPRLLVCSRYRMPKQHEIYENAVNVEFDVTVYGMVASEHVVEEDHLLSAKGTYAEALERIRSCRFQPAEYWGRAVAVRMRMWVIWSDGGALTGRPLEPRATTSGRPQPSPFHW